MNEYIKYLIDTQALQFGEFGDCPYSVDVEKIAGDKQFAEFVLKAIKAGDDSDYVFALDKQAEQVVANIVASGEKSAYCKGGKVTLVLTKFDREIAMNAIGAFKAQGAEVVGLVVPVDTLLRSHTVKSHLLQLQLDSGVNCYGVVNMGHIIKYLSQPELNVVNPMVKRSLGMYYMKNGAKNED